MPKVGEIIIAQNKPVIIEFQNGKIQPGEEKSLESAFFIDTRRHKKVVGLANGDMVYSGEINVDDEDLFNNFLAIQEEGSKKIQLIQIDTCTVAPSLEKKTPVKTTPVKTQSLADLKKQFGSKKAKRFTEQQERLTMNIENVTEHLEKTVADITVTEMPSTLLDDNETLYKPKINRDASSKDQVYLLADLVPIEVLDSLEERMLEILESEDIKEFELIPTVEKNIIILKASLPEKVLVSKCKILLYIHYLVKFMVTPLKSMNKKFIICDCSEDVDKHIKDNYMINWTRPISMKDKGLCYAIVLLMIAMDYEADLEQISKDLKIGLKKMQEFSRNLGFSPSSKNKSSVVLKIPVPPPILPNLKRKRSSV